MSASASKVSLLLLAAIALGASLAVIGFLQLFFERSTKEVIEGWYQSEQVSLQQGNLLSSVTKLQRLIEHSSLLDSVVVIDSEGRQLIQIGAPARVNFELLRRESSNLHRVSRGLFTSSYYFRNGEAGVCVFASAPLLIVATVLMSVYFIVVAGSAGLFLRRAIVAEEASKVDSQLSEMRSKVAVAEALSKLAKQVAHDIRGPVSALRIAASAIRSSEVHSELIFAATERVNAIAEDLLNESRRTIYSVHLSSVIQDVIAEKAILYPALRIKQKLLPNLLVSVDPQILARVLSNLLNNAIEANADMDAVIHVTTDFSDSTATITIRDFGVGMTNEEISQVLTGRFQSMKPGGSGLGISHAVSELNELGGKLEIFSNKGQGTSVQIQMPGTAS